MSNKLADTRADRDNLNDQIKCNRLRLKTLKHFFIIHIIPWDPMGWDGINCESHGMGWDEKIFFEYPMGWDGINCESHGTIFSSHPIPFGAMVQGIHC